MKAYRTWDVVEADTTSCQDQKGGASYWYVVERNPKKGRRSINLHVKRFPSEESARIYAAMRTDEDLERERVKAGRRREKAQAQKQTPNPFKVGMIFENSWGYDQTNVDYYEVTRVTPRGVYVRAIGCKSVVHSGEAHGMADRVVPDKGSFKGPEIFKQIREGSDKGYLSAEFGCMKLVDEWEATYRSWYH